MARITHAPATPCPHLLCDAAHAPSRREPEAEPAGNALRLPVMAALHAIWTLAWIALGAFGVGLLCGAVYRIGVGRAWWIRVLTAIAGLPLAALLFVAVFAAAVLPWLY